MSEQTLIDKIIGQVFAESGVKLTHDDPVLGLIIVQHKLLDEKLNGLEAKIQAFADSVNQSNNTLANTLSDLQTYRKGILTDLVAESKRQANELVDVAMGEYGHKLISGLHSKTQGLIVASHKEGMKYTKLSFGVLVGFLILLLIVVAYYAHWPKAFD